MGSGSRMGSPALRVKGCSARAEGSIPGAAQGFVATRCCAWPKSGRMLNVCSPSLRRELKERGVPAPMG